MQGWAKVGLQLSVCKTQLILVLLFINYYVISHMNNCKCTFVHPCMFLARPWARCFIYVILFNFCDNLLRCKF